MYIYDGKDGSASNRCNPFRSNGKVMDEMDIEYRKLENIGAKITSRSGRDFHFFIVDILRENVEKCVSMIAESVMCPSLFDEDIMESSVPQNNIYYHRT